MENLINELTNTVYGFEATETTFTYKGHEYQIKDIDTLRHDIINIFIKEVVDKIVELEQAQPVVDFKGDRYYIDGKEMYATIFIQDLEIDGDYEEFFSIMDELSLIQDAFIACGLL